jgi:hypothetical protein
MVEATHSLQQGRWPSRPRKDEPSGPDRGPSQG